MTHQDIEQLLPWYLNGTLVEGERRAVGDHLRECADCARELQALEDVQVAVRNAAQETSGPSPFLVTRALASIDEYEQKRAGKSRSWLDWWKPIPLLARLALVLQLAAIIGLGSYLLALRDRGPYVTAGPGSAATQGPGARIAVMFDPGAPEERIRELLRSLGASIVSGPSALGLYTLELPVGQSDAEHVDRALQMLRGNHELVRFAEQLK